MSKKNLLLGTAAGKVGDLVFYRAGGEQRTRSKVTPSNPKTYAQQAQRSRMANVTLMFRAMKALLDDSFTNRPTNQSAFNAFSAEALPISAYLLKEDAVKGKFIPIPTLISKGVMNEPYAFAINTPNQKGVAFYANDDDPVATVANLTAVLLREKPCCFSEGSIIIFPYLVSEDGEFPDKFQMRVAKATLSTSDTTTLSELGMSATIHEAVGNNRPTLQLLFNGQTGAQAWGFVVLTPKTGGGYRSNTEFLRLTDEGQEAYVDNCSKSAALKAAISYGGAQGSCL